MQEIRYAMVDGEKVPVLISDENEALQAAKAARRAVVGLWREDGKENEWCADTLITDVEDADEEFLERIARRHLGLPWTICETERLILREIAERDYEEIVKNHVDDGLDTAEKIAGYTKHHYEVFEFGFWAVEEKKSGNLAGVVGFRIPQDDAAGDVEDWLLSFDDENIRNIGDRGMRKRHVWRLLNMRKRNSEQFSFSHGSKRIISCRRRWRRDLDS